MLQAILRKKKPAPLLRNGLIILAGCILLVTALALWRGNLSRTAKASAAIHPITEQNGVEKVLADKLLRQLEKYAPLHARFAAASLSIERQDRQKALEEMLVLQEQLKGTSSDRADPLLQAFTLVQIAFLYQLDGQKENERIAWQGIEEQADWNGPRKGPLAESFASLEANFSCEGTRFRDYVRYRLTHL